MDREYEGEIWDIDATVMAMTSEEREEFFSHLDSGHEASIARLMEEDDIPWT